MKFEGIGLSRMQERLEILVLDQELLARSHSGGGGETMEFFVEP